MRTDCPTGSGSGRSAEEGLPENTGGVSCTDKDPNSCQPTKVRILYWWRQTNQIRTQKVINFLERNRLCAMLLIVCQYESLARSLLPVIQKYYESDEGKQAFAEWKEKKEAAAKDST